VRRWRRAGRTKRRATCLGRRIDGWKHDTRNMTHLEEFIGYLEKAWQIELSLIVSLTAWRFGVYI
jgi:hypothetical protein